MKDERGFTQTYTMVSVLFYHEGWLDLVISDPMFPGALHSSDKSLRR